MYNLALRETQFEMTFELDNAEIKKKIVSKKERRIKMVQVLSAMIGEAFAEFCRYKGIAYRTKVECTFMREENPNEIKFHIIVIQQRNIANWLFVAFWLPTLFITEENFRKDILLSPAIDFGLFLNEKSLQIEEGVKAPQ